MKLYQPPIKKSQLPTANPFLSKNLLDPIPTEEPSSKGAEKVDAGNYTSFGDLYASQVQDSKESRRSQSYMKKTYAHGQKKAPARMHSSNSMARAQNKPALDRIDKRLQFLQSTNELLQYWRKS